MKEDKNRVFYIKLREKITSWAESKGFKDSKTFKYIIAAPDFFYLLWKLSMDKDLPAEDRLLVGIALFYFISPFDLFPEGVMGPIGYIDDIAIAAYVIRKIINKAGEKKVKQYWLGEEELLTSIESILVTVDSYIGSGLWRRLVNLVESWEKKGGRKEEKDKKGGVVKKRNSSKEEKSVKKKATTKKAVKKQAKRGRPKKSSNKKKEE